MKIVIATTNQNKIKEIKNKIHASEMLDLLSLNDFPGYPDVNEDGSTFSENALKKSIAYSKFTGMITLADDSGLVVDALNGEPGVYSRRYAGNNATDDDNNDFLLKKLDNTPDGKRTARFVCAIAIALPGGEEFLAEGICEGRILQYKKGINGFGYDPVFYLPVLKKTMAELTVEEKNRISHRAAAIEKALKIIKQIHKEKNS
jgi:XTP/dITP diphosphohydrolase